MDKPFEYKGKWYLPSQNQNEAIAGILKFQPNDGITLELIGSFKDQNELEIIWGTIESGKAVTLYNSFVTRRQYMFSNFEIATYVSNVILIGGWFDDKNDLKFYKASASYSHLDDWLNISNGFNIQHDSSKLKTQIEYQLPKSTEISITSGFTLTINPTAKGPSRKLIQKDASIIQKIYLNFETNRKIHFDKYLANVFHFQNFLTLATQNAIFVKELSLYFKVSGDKKLHEAKVYFQLTHISKPKEELMPFDMIIPYQDLKNNFEQIVKKWYEIKPQLETSLHQYMSVFYAPFLYVSDRFLNLCRSLEAYHRDFINDRRVYFVNRCKEVIKNNSHVYNSTLKIPSIPSFSENIKTFRNDFTHSNPLTSKQKKYLKTHKYSEYLKLIMACTFLIETGIDREILKKNIEKSRLYTHLKHKL